MVSYDVLERRGLAGRAIAQLLQQKVTEAIINWSWFALVRAGDSR